MPKIIKNIEQHIFTAAIDLFSEFGYRKVNMNMIAQKADIAVGTLYNYYPNKKTLFMNVLEKSWEKSLQRLNNIVEEDLASQDKLERAVDFLYAEMSNRKGLGRGLMKEDLFSEEDFTRMFNFKNKLLKKMEEFILEVKKDRGLKLEEGMEKRLASLVLTGIMELEIHFPAEKGKNIAFIRNILKNVYGSG